MRLPFFIYKLTKGRQVPVCLSLKGSGRDKVAQTHILSLNLSSKMFLLLCYHHPQTFLSLHAVCDRRMEHEPFNLYPHGAVVQQVYMCFLVSPTSSWRFVPSFPECRVSFSLCLEALLPLNQRVSYCYLNMYKGSLCYKKRFTVEAVVGFVHSLTCCEVRPVVKLIL